MRTILIYHQEMVATNRSYPQIPELNVVPLVSRADLQTVVCCELFDYWEGLRSTGRLDVFDLIEIPAVIPFVVVLDRSDAGSTFRFKLNGQNIVEASGHDLTGEILSTGGEEAPLTLKFCKAILEHQAPVVSSAEFQVEIAGRTMRFNETIALPLMDVEERLESIVLVHGPA